MNSVVNSRVIVTADAYGWSSSNHGRDFFEKDGYEIYFFNLDDGFELTVRNPESMERETIVEIRDDDIDTSSPLYVAALEHILMNAENIVSERM
jgi:hypothetical protein